MTLSIELLPAPPLGPIMARISSCSRTSNRNVGQRLDATKAQRDVVDLEDYVPDLACFTHEAALLLIGRRRASPIFTSAAMLPCAAIFELHLGFDVLHGLVGQSASNSGAYFSA